MVSAKNENKGSRKAGDGANVGKQGRSVGEALRQAYDDAVNEAVPDDLLALLKKLD